MGTSKRAVVRLENGTEKEWDEVDFRAFFRYRRVPVKNVLSPFQLVYVVNPKVLPHELMYQPSAKMTYYQKTKLLALLEPRSERAEEQKKNSKYTNASPVFLTGYLVLVVYGKVFKEVRWPPFKAKMYGGFKLIKAEHLLYTILLSAKRRSHVSIHAQRLVFYHLCGNDTDAAQRQVAQVNKSN